MSKLLERASKITAQTKGVSAPGNRNTSVVSGKGPRSNSASQIPNERIKKALVIWERPGKPVVG